MKKKTWMILFLAAVTALTFGCGEHDDHHDDDHDDHLEEEACLHMENGPSSPVAGGVDAASATDTSEGDWEHKRVDLPLSENGESFIGFVTLEIDSEGDYFFFVDKEATLEIDGVGPESSETEADCDEISHVQVFELSVGEHTLKVTSAEPVVQIVLEGSAEGTHDDH